MAGRAGRSGGTTKLQFTPLQPSTPPPGLDGTADANMRFCAWVAFELASGNMDPITANAATATARVELAGIRTKHGLGELDELRAMCARMEKATSTKARQESAERYVSTTDATTTLGRVRSPDGETH